MSAKWSSNRTNINPTANVCILGSQDKKPAVNSRHGRPCMVPSHKESSAATGSNKITNHFISTKVPSSSPTRFREEEERGSELQTNPGWADGWQGDQNAKKLGAGRCRWLVVKRLGRRTYCFRSRALQLQHRRRRPIPVTRCILRMGEHGVDVRPCES